MRRTVLRVAAGAGSSFRAETSLEPLPESRTSGTLWDMNAPLGDNEVPGTPTAQGRWHRRLRRVVPESAYVLAVATIATLGFTTESTASILIAVLLALPTGAPALIGYYIAYGLLAQVPGANPSSSSGSAGCSADGVCHESSTGDAALWFTHTTDLLGILALTAAAVLNLVFLRILVAKRRAHRQFTPH